MPESYSELNFEDYCRIAQQFSYCMNDYLYVYDVKQDTYYITERALQRFMLPGSVFHNVVATHSTFVYEEDIPALTEDLNQIVTGEKDEHNLKYRWLGKDGSPIWINCKGRMLKDSQGKPSIMIGCINEIGNRQKADNVTGLLGEFSLQEHLELLSPEAPEGIILRIGIDDFKIINERHGLDFGNLILRSVADCIRNCLSPLQYAYRIVSDEFVVLDLSDSSIEDANELYHRIRSAVDEIVEKHQYKALYTISAGVIALEEIASTDYNEIMKLSEFALTEAKNRGKNQIYYFNSDDYADFLRKRRLRSSLRKSISNNFEGFDLYYQPLIMINGERLYAAETLLRYRTQEGEAVSPLELIPILEETGLIIPVGKWILKNALAMCAKCREHIPSFNVSVNLSYIQLLKSPMFDDIMETLEETGLPPSSLIVELTESGHLENSPAIQNVWKKLKREGVQIAIDDFGTGYSNLQNIGNLRPDIVKIDRSFTLKALRNDYEYELLIHIIRMVHSIGLNLVVEGIETQEELQKITALNPDYIQGYYYSKPCSLSEFTQKYLSQK